MIPDQIIEKIKKASKRLLLLDYDGTLVDFKISPREAVPSAELLKVIEKLAADSRTRIVIVTGRKHEEIEKFVGNMPVTIIAEHGAIKKSGNNWIYQIHGGTPWKKLIRPVFENAVRECPGSFIEEKRYSLVWHYRGCDAYAGDNCAEGVIMNVKKAAEENGLRILAGEMAIEVMTGEAGKAKAVRQLTGSGIYDCILCIGDGRTDEDMFEYLKDFDNAVTIKVGTGKTAAGYQVDGVNDVIDILRQLPE